MIQFGASSYKKFKAFHQLTHRLANLRDKAARVNVKKYLNRNSVRVGLQERGQTLEQMQ